LLRGPIDYPPPLVWISSASAQVMRRSEGADLAEGQKDVDTVEAELKVLHNGFEIARSESSWVCPTTTRSSGNCRSALVLKAGRGRVFDDLELAFMPSIRVIRVASQKCVRRCTAQTGRPPRHSRLAKRSDRDQRSRGPPLCSGIRTSDLEEAYCCDGSAGPVTGCGGPAAAAAGAGASARAAADSVPVAMAVAVAAGSAPASGGVAFPAICASMALGRAGWARGSSRKAVHSDFVP
jgi:hypothetical protein